ncbi:MAG: hypothetical protein V8R15_08905 [Bacilli bacterium]|jgi:NADH dehydrogenase/NADH:ubiquinone oxidoreductase 75 kD subunit (chain G)
MAVYINHKEYEFIEEMSIFEYIRQYQIFLPSLDEKLDEYDKEELCYVEIEEQSQLVNAKETMVLDEMHILTNSKKVYSYLYDFLKVRSDHLKEKLNHIIDLKQSDYNILLCSPECYDSCLNRYKEKGFNDIISLKLFQMVEFTELTHEFIKRIANKLDQNKNDKLLVVEPQIIAPFKKMSLNLKPAEEIAAQLIKTYYKEMLKIDTNINILYVTTNIKEVICHHSKSNLYISMIDDIACFDHLEVRADWQCFDGNMSREIYKKIPEFLNVSCDYTTIFKNLRQMGLKEESLEVFTNKLGKEIVLTYHGFKLTILFTELFLTKEEIKELSYDLIWITYKDFSMHINNEEGFLGEYNLNRLYKNVLVYPGYSNLFRRY